MARLPDQDKIHEFLKSVSLFREVDTTRLSDFIRQSIVRSYRKGAIIINQDDETLISKHFPNATIRTVNNAGHWLHAENPKEFYDNVMDFIS